jgi:PhoH-like ATPase
VNGVPAEGWGHTKLDEVKYSKIPEVMVPDQVIIDLYQEKAIDAAEAPEIILNSYAVLKSDCRESHAVVFNNGLELELINHKPQTLFKLSPKNLDQTCAMHALSKVDIPMVALVGPAGSGKTLLAIAAGLDALLEKKSVEKLIIVRSPVPVGKDIGFLPGSLDEKLRPWAGAFWDNLDVLLKGKGKNLEMFIESGQIEICPMTFMRGRSLNKTFVVLDEGQNLGSHEMKTLATRIGEGSRLVITGDLEQIDNPRGSSADNGLANITAAFKGTKWAVCLDLVKGERSGFASAAADLL